jgi:hypothetical protein
MRALCVSGVKSFSWGFHLLQRELNFSASPMYAHLLTPGTSPGFIIKHLQSPMVVVLFLELIDTSITERLVASYYFS